MKRDSSNSFSRLSREPKEVNLFIIGKIIPNIDFYSVFENDQNRRCTGPFVISLNNRIFVVHRMYSETDITIHSTTLGRQPFSGDRCISYVPRGRIQYVMSKVS